MHPVSSGDSATSPLSGGRANARISVLGPNSSALAAETLGLPCTQFNTNLLPHTVANLVNLRAAKRSSLLLSELQKKVVQSGRKWLIQTRHLLSQTGFALFKAVLSLTLSHTVEGLHARQLHSMTN